MRLLCLDTATEACSAAVLDGDALYQRFEVAGRAHTQKMLPAVHGLMQEAGLKFSDLDGLVCGVGPGSFAGVRIGTGFIKGLSLALDKPVVAITSLQMLAQAQLDSGAERVVVAIDARMDEVYFAAYGRDPQGLALEISPARVCAPEQVRIHEASGQWHAAGSGWARYREIMTEALRCEISHVDAEALPHASAGMKLARPLFERRKTLHADDLAPVYLRNKVALTLEEQVQLRKKARKL